MRTDLLGFGVFVLVALGLFLMFVTAPRARGIYAADAVPPWYVFKLSFCPDGNAKRFHQGCRKEERSFESMKECEAGISLIKRERAKEIEEGQLAILGSNQECMEYLGG